jgi:hypothetical protein
VMLLEAIPQQEFQKCFQQWQHHWAKCIVTQGSTSKYTGMIAMKSFRKLHSHTSHNECYPSKCHVVIFNFFSLKSYLWCFLFTPSMFVCEICCICEWQLCFSCHFLFILTVTFVSKTFLFKVIILCAELLMGICS